MRVAFSLNSRTSRLAAAVAFTLSFVLPFLVAAQEPLPAPPSVNVTQESGPPKRIPRQQALTSSAIDGIVRENVSEGVYRPIAAARIELKNLQTGQSISLLAGGDGVFRIVPVVPGSYELEVQAAGYASFHAASLAAHANEVLTLEITLAPATIAEMRSRLPRQPELGPALPANTPPSLGSYREFRHRLDSDPNYILELAPDVLPPVADVFNAVPNRWALEQPDYRRYSPQGEYIYVKPRWYDPFNRNRFKGDEPIWPEFLGQQVFLQFHRVRGDVSRWAPRSHAQRCQRRATRQRGIFRPVASSSFSIRPCASASICFTATLRSSPWIGASGVTPELSLNYLDVQELGIVSPDVRKGTTRFDSHLGLQEAFVGSKAARSQPQLRFRFRARWDSGI